MMEKNKCSVQTKLKNVMKHHYEALKFYDMLMFFRPCLSSGYAGWLISE